jgi:hypothetical protein
MHLYRTNSFIVPAGTGLVETKTFVAISCSKALGKIPRQDIPNEKGHERDTNRHQDFLTTTHHTDTATVNLHGCRLRCSNLFLKGVMQHLECNRLMSGGTSMDRSYEQTRRWIRYI